MQYDEAKRLREKQGGEECSHADFDKEYYLGAQTGDYVCTSCGETFSRAQVNAIEAKRAKG